MSFIDLFIILFTLLSIETIYLRIAKYFNIIDIPNARSLHRKIVVRGGGIIYWVATALYFVSYQCTSYWFFIGLSLLMGISFLDDIVSLPSHYRLWFQLVAIALLLYQLNIQSVIEGVWVWILVGSVGVGIINAYNFMDGVNGITGLYSLIMLATLGYINHYEIVFVDYSFINIISLSVLVFLFFNFRKKAVCFGGDVGSVGMAFILLFLVATLMLQTHDLRYIFFFTLYGLDTVYTIVYRLGLKQNIFEAHKLHFFQLLVYHFKFTHLQVAVFYGFLQLILNLWVIKHSVTSFVFYVPVVVLLLLMHFFRKKANMAFYS